ncbi:hypothetical protein FJY69_10925, partial [candidate division WOR-3 bacterium]|nr:hypothetical protein [candidate division WOR-3 bacterium]
MCMFRVLLVLGCLVSAVSAQSLERSIGLPDSLGVMGFSHRMAFDPVHDKLYAAGTGALSILGGPGGRRIGLVRAPAAGDPFYAGLHLDAQRNRLYWVRGYDTIISIVSTESNSVVGQLMTRPVSMLRHGEFAACIDTVNHRLYASTLDGLAV